MTSLVRGIARAALAIFAIAFVMLLSPLLSWLPNRGAPLDYGPDDPGVDLDPEDLP